MVATVTPQRVLVVSAEMGEGHNAAARALIEAMSRLWPGCRFQQTDVIELRGRRFAHACRSAYRYQLKHAPWLYQFLYDAVSEHPWFARVGKRVTGSFLGRRLRPVIKHFDPDVIVSTYPLGSAALHWLRRARHLEQPTVSFVTDFDANPFWLYSAVDLHCVAHDALVAEARAAVRGPVQVSAPAVGRRFHPADGREARRIVGLRDEAFIVLVTGGAWGVGSLEEAVQTLVQEVSGVQVVAVCGRSEEVRARMDALALPRSRLVTFGFVENMPQLMAASDVVLTNGAGATVMEALASGRPVVAFDPLAGHGRAAAARMQQLGLTVVCSRPEDLAVTIGDMASGGRLLERLQAAGADFLEGRDLLQDVERLGGLPSHRSARWRRAARTGLRAAVAATVVLFVLLQLSFLAGTRFARAARGGPEGSRQVAIVLAGSLSPSVLRWVDAELTSAGLPLTVFLQGSDAAANRGVVPSLVRHGVEVEPGLWRGCRDDQLRPADTRSEFARSVDTVASLTGKPPQYVAEPCGRFSLVAVMITNNLHIRRVIFAGTVMVDDQVASLPAIRPGGILEIRVGTEARPEDVGQTLLALSSAVRAQGLQLATVATIDGRDTSAAQPLGP